MAYSHSIDPTVQAHMRRVKKYQPSDFLLAVEIQARINEKEKWTEYRRQGYRDLMGRYFNAIRYWDPARPAPERMLVDVRQELPEGTRRKPYKKKG